MAAKASAASPSPAAVMANPSYFEAPPVELGQVVLWSHGPGAKPTPAIVIGVATHTLNLSVHVDGIRDHLSKQGVRHCDDPLIRTRPPSDQGVWDLTPRDKRINFMLGTYAPLDEE